jgi:hypothetical protein
MPEFLKPMLRDEVSRVLRTRHLAYTEGVADAVLTIAFSSSPMARDDTRREGENDALVHFEAELNLEFRNSVTDERIWSGTMSRAHHVAEGETMHDDRARSALRVALSELFADFPDPAWPVR